MIHAHTNTRTHQLVCLMHHHAIGNRNRNRVLNRDVPRTAVRCSTVHAIDEPRHDNDAKRRERKNKKAGGGPPHRGGRCSRWTGGRRGTRGPPWLAAPGGTWRSPASRDGSLTITSHHTVLSRSPPPSLVARSKSKGAPLATHVWPCRPRAYITVEHLSWVFIKKKKNHVIFTDSTLPPQRRGIPWGRP